ncbi:glycosyltransferase family 4 protein [Candidatus Entotheonella palauensis]|uniref:glycosyltransferase family 4 protein n=1 Tax=Candidatus Entotheonella palauensis TaxID=93172 RepID=UPI0015C45187|nr:glycosyltransferase family 4 protein [Candidatus Entotheonella palauensis]
MIERLQLGVVCPSFLPGCSVGSSSHIRSGRQERRSEQVMERHILILGCKNYPGFSSSKVISSGMEVYVTELVKYLKSCYRITLITADSAVSQEDNIRVVSQPIFGGRLFQPISLFFFSFLPALKLRKQIDLINTQTPLSGLIAYLLKKWFRIPYVVSVHMYASSSEHTGSRLYSAIYHYIEKIVYSAADKIVCAGYGLRDHIIEQHRVDPNRIVVINPGAGPVEVGEPSPSCRREAHQDDGGLKVLFLGRLIQENGIIDLLEAMKLLTGQPVKLLIAGNGNLERYIRQFIDKHKLQDHIEMLGIVSGEAKDKLLKSVHVLIRTSYHEVFPVAYLEALAYGIPVIATPVGDTAYMAEQTGGIDLVPVNDPGGTASAIAGRMHHHVLEPELIDRCQNYLRDISWENQADKTVALFNEVMSRHESLGETF